MKRSFFSYFVEAYGNKYPYGPRVRRTLWGLIGFCLLSILVDHCNDKLFVAALPASGSAYETKTLSTYAQDTVLSHGRLVIAEPTLMQRMFLPNLYADCKLFTLIGMIIASLIIIRMTPKQKGEHLFRRDISGSLHLLGSLIILHAVITYAARNYATNEVAALTNGEFTTTPFFPLLLCAEGYAGFIVIAMGTWYKRAVKLQEEKDLTI